MSLRFSLRMKIHYVFLTLVLIQICSSMPNSLGVSCKDHPAYVDGVKPVIVRSWEILYGLRTLPGMYLVGHGGHRYAPIDNPDSLEYDRLDWFWVTKGGPPREKYIRLSLNRPAKVYLMVPFNRRKSKRTPILSGWTSEGILKLVNTGRDSSIEYGIFQKTSKNLPSIVHLFSRETEGDILLPNTRWVEQVAKGIDVTGEWIVMVSEIDGTAPILQYPANPPEVTDAIEPNVRCPDQLHDLWVTRNSDEGDEDTRGKEWRTWHPQWDPCYWCGYDHEHGSSPKHLMGYEPKFHYVAWKNGREPESHEGYKGYVFRYESLFVYFMVHMQTSNLRRVSVRHHTIIMAVTDAETKELLMEVSHKADFGFIGVKGRNGRLIPLTKDEKNMQEHQLAEGSLRKMRSINVIDFAKPNPSYLFKTPKKEMRRGVYETWTTVPLCAADNKLGLVTFDVITSVTGITTATTAQPKKLNLGFYRFKTFFRQTGAPRLLKLSTFTAGEDHCCFMLSNMNGRRYEDGSFYTDAYGKTLRDGPSESAVRQYVKPGFNMKLSGRYGAVESWTGLYKHDEFGAIVNYGFSINPDIN